MLLNCGIEEDSWESLGLQGDPASQFYRKSVLNIHWKEWCWSWNSNTLGTWCKELTHWKRPWCWEGSGAGGEGDERGWDGWMASPTRWTWVWVNSRSWWWTGRPSMLLFMGSQRVGHDWATELNWPTPVFLVFLCGSHGRESACNEGDLGLNSGLEDPLEEGMATHSSILAWRIPMDRAAWWAAVHGVPKSHTWLST